MMLEADEELCLECDGRGYQTTIETNFNTMMTVTSRQKCRQCDGQGEINRCRECGKRIAGLDSTGVAGICWDCEMDNET